MSTFEDRLLRELRTIVADTPAPSTTTPAARLMRRPRLALSGAGALTAAGVAAALIATGGGGATAAAYAVQARPDGAVTVTIHSLRDAAGLQAKLRAAGVPADVDYKPGGAAPTCAPPPGAMTETGHHEGPTTDRVVGGTTAGGPSTRQAGQAPPPGKGHGKVTMRVDRGTPVGGSVDADGATFTIDPTGVPAGQRLSITTSDGTVSSIGMRIGTGPGAAC